MTLHHISGNKQRQKRGQDAKRWRALLQLMKDDKASITLDGFEFTKEWSAGIVEYLDAIIEEQDKQEHAEKQKRRRRQTKFRDSLIKNN